MCKELEGVRHAKVLEMFGTEMLRLCLVQMIAAHMTEMGDKGD